MIKRLRNLWRLSSVELPKETGKEPLVKVLETIKEALNPPQKATIVKMDDPLAEFNVQTDK